MSCIQIPDSILFSDLASHYLVSIAFSRSFGRGFLYWLLARHREHLDPQNKQEQVCLGGFAQHRWRLASSNAPPTGLDVLLQAQDRCHRIGQTREVHIYRLVSEKTIEENILTKSDQKRQLDHLAIQSGGFNTEFLQKFNPRELLGVQPGGTPPPSCSNPMILFPCCCVSHVWVPTCCK